MAKKSNRAAKAFKALTSEPPVTSYPYNNNRVMIVDWASLSYHMFYSIGSDKNRAKYGLMSSEGEIELWRTKMVTKLMDYVALFNPKHIIFALEGKAAWRKKYVERYYDEHAVIYWNSSEYYVQADNYLYMVQKATVGDGYAITKLKASDRLKLGELSHKLLGKMPQKQHDMFWKLKLPKGQPVLPSYKGHRASKPWTFFTDKKVWAEYREQFAQELAPLFRARAIQCLHAEGDDIIYAAAKQLAVESDDVIVITKDSDMTQIKYSNVKIFNHQTDTFSTQDDPEKYLDLKVLMGDSSDNINGMAFVNPKDGSFAEKRNTQLSDVGAADLLANCPNVYEAAKKYGWDDQYMRNRTLIDLSRVPPDVTQEIDMQMDLMREPDFVAGFELLDFWHIPERIQSTYRIMQTSGFFALNNVNTTNVLDIDAYNKQKVEAAHVPLEVVDSVATAENFGVEDELDVNF